MNKNDKITKNVKYNSLNLTNWKLNLKIKLIQNITKILHTHTHARTHARTHTHTLHQRFILHLVKKMPFYHP